MKTKKVLLLLIVILLSAVLLSVSCNSNGEAAETDNAATSNFFLDSGFKNCLICHGSGDDNPTKNLTNHCLHYDPEGYVKITDINYSPTLADCLKCHTSHVPEGPKTTYVCGRCHYG
jgi:ABC-type oligopeptide transport system substrate-binding subunit